MVTRPLYIKVAVTALLLLFFLLMANPAGYYFLNDDFVQIPLAAKRHFVHGNLLRPIANLTLWLDHRLWGQHAAGYHLTNIFIHLVNTALVWLLGRRLFQDYGDGKDAALKSWLAALFFLLYAFHSEPVFWIIGRGGSLSSLFFLIACLGYLRRDVSYWYFFFSLLAFCGGLFVYEAIWIFPLVAVFLSAAGIYLGKKKWRTEWGYLAGIFGFFIVYLVFRHWQTGSLGGEYVTGTLLGAEYYRLFYNYSAMLARSFIPPMLSSRLFVASFAVVGLLLALAVFFIVRKRKRPVLIGLLVACFLVGLLPAVSLGIDIHDTESERFIYLPSVFCVLLITEIFSSLITDGRMMVRCMLLLIILHGYWLWQASEDYRYGGRVARQTLAFIEEGGARDAGGGGKGDGREEEHPAGGKGVIYAVHPPSQYGGALIFRFGFEPAFRWICPGVGYQHMVTIGGRELRKRRDSLQCVREDLPEAMLTMGAVSKVDSMRGGVRVVMADTSFVFFPARDMLLYWTDSTLVQVGR